MKSQRQAKILEIISNKNIETQEQLLEQLKLRGFAATQATISRDIKQLRLVKELSPGGSYRYVPTDRKNTANASSRLRNIFREGVTSVDVAQNLVVVKTMPGLASAACSALDSMEINGMVGTLAGDDTGLLIMQDNASAVAFSNEVHKLFK